MGLLGLAQDLPNPSVRKTFLLPTSLTALPIVEFRLGKQCGTTQLELSLAGQVTERSRNCLSATDAPSDNNRRHLLLTFIEAGDISFVEYFFRYLPDAIIYFCTRPETF